MAAGAAVCCKTDCLQGLHLLSFEFVPGTRACWTGKLQSVDATVALVHLCSSAAQAVTPGFTSTTCRGFCMEGIAAATAPWCMCIQSVTLPFAGAGACWQMAAEPPLVCTAAARNAAGRADMGICRRRPPGRLRRCAAIGCHRLPAGSPGLLPLLLFSCRQTLTSAFWGHVKLFWLVYHGMQAMPEEPLAATASSWVCASCKQVQGRALLPAAGLFELAAAAAGMLVACDALPPSAAQGSLIADAAIAAPCVLAGGGTPQLVLCTVDAG